MNRIEELIKIITSRQSEVDAAAIMPQQKTNDPELVKLIAELEDELNKAGIKGGMCMHCDGIGWSSWKEHYPEYNLTIIKYSIAAKGDSSIGGCASELAGKNTIIPRISVAANTKINKLYRDMIKKNK